MLDCAPPAIVTIIEAPADNIGGAVVDFLLAPLQPLREQLTAITGIGLDADVPEGAALRRMTLRLEGGGTLNYLASGTRAGARVVFIHGSPGVAEEWAGFLANVPAGQYRAAVDRPGFGESIDQEPVLSIGEQARAIAPLLGDGSVVVGYSFGGPVALRLAVDFPDKVGSVVLIGSAGDPAQEETHPLQLVAALPYFSALLPAELANSNAELLALRPELEQLATGLGRIAAPVTIVQGLQDTLVPPENAAYIRAQLSPDLPARVVLIEGGDHFLPWTHAPLIEEVLACAVADAAGQPPPEASPR
ncbi:alpha/beta fold hydrolase [Aquibium carbonis]|uniref:Alpha/beta fold hydrolase n=1 Tax=Aquibium carbonis TaxID=2495581 RepID=A0A429YD67_9HYPH|nr:alpha/beta fold hydrolase [Aquibium carbonis]RST79361.1 alpha/beta fold hydrolase [Aquibium carbonis]